MPTTQSKTAQHFVPISDVRDGIVILKNGQLNMVLLASSINFALKSSTEQQAILSQFQAFFNALDFSVQMYVQSRRLDIRPYIELLESREADQYNDLMRIQLKEYIEFIRTFTNEVDIMSKNFFVIIPYSSTTMDAKGIKSALQVGKKAPPFDPKKFEEDRSQLEQRITIVEQGLARIGVRTIPLGNEELVELFYHIFNPDDQQSAPKLR